MEYTVRAGLLGTAVVLAVGIGASIITSTVVVSRSIDQKTRLAAKGYHSINVKGSARQRVSSDTGVWDISVAGDGATLQEAYGVLEQGVVRVRKHLTDGLRGGGDRSQPDRHGDALQA
jgi:hypothetical protein